MLISIIIPTYNSENDIVECVESVYAQTYSKIEVICIDNNSTDGTWQKLIELKNKYPTLIIDKEAKQGAPAARNKGLSIAKGQWVQFLDSDDLLLQGKFETQIQKINSQSCDLLVAAYIKEFLNKTRTTSIPDSDTFKGLFTTNLGITSSNLWKRQILNLINGWDEALSSSQEYDLLFRYIKQTENVCKDNIPNTIVRERIGSISKTNEAQNRERFVGLRIQIFEYLKGNKTEYFIKYQNQYLLFLFDFIRTLYPYNPKMALAYYKQFFTSDFSPEPSAATTSSYIRLFKLFGFKKTEYLKRLLK